MYVILVWVFGVFLFYLSEVVFGLGFMGFFRGAVCFCFC